MLEAINVMKDAINNVHDTNRTIFDNIVCSELSDCLVITLNPTKGVYCYAILIENKTDTFGIWKYGDPQGTGYLYAPMTDDEFRTIKSLIVRR